jgi:hypothetical protein
LDGATAWVSLEKRRREAGTPPPPCLLALEKTPSIAAQIWHQTNGFLAFFSLVHFNRGLIWGDISERVHANQATVPKPDDDDIIIAGHIHVSMIFPLFQPILREPTVFGFAPHDLDDLLVCLAAAQIANHLRRVSHRQDRA